MTADERAPMTDSERELLLALAAMLLALRSETNQGVDYDFYGNKINMLCDLVAGAAKPKSGVSDEPRR
jgi:hypothetical protein